MCSDLLDCPVAHQNLSLYCAWLWNWIINNNTHLSWTSTAVAFKFFHLVSSDTFSFKTRLPSSSWILGSLATLSPNALKSFIWPTCCSSSFLMSCDKTVQWSRTRENCHVGRMILIPYQESRVETICSLLILLSDVTPNNTSPCHFFFFSVPCILYSQGILGPM